MAEKGAAEPIIVKRVKKVVGGHGGGVWKIAYADFVTAMMAFFLLMWVLGSTTSGDLAGISAYFQNPLRLTLEGGQGSGDQNSIIKGAGRRFSAPWVASPRQMQIPSSGASVILVWKTTIT